MGGGGRRRAQFGIRFVGCTLALVLSRAALADAPDAKRDAAAAEVLFRAGVAALAGHDFDTACAKFEASLELDPAVATLLQVAECHERQGALAQAWADVSRASVLNRDTPGDQRRRDLDAYANALLRRLEKRVPRLRILITSPPPGLALRRNDVLLPNAAVGEAIPMDAGDVRIEATAPGYLPARKQVKLAEGKVTDVPLRLVPERLGDDSSGLPAGSATHRVVPAWAWITGGAGVLLLGTSAAFAVSQASTQAEIDRQCPPPRALCATSYDYRAANDRLYLDFGFFLGTGAAGLLALGAGVTGIFTAPKTTTAAPASTGVSRVEPWVSQRFVGVSISGVF